MNTVLTVIVWSLLIVRSIIEIYALYTRGIEHCPFTTKTSEVITLLWLIFLFCWFCFQIWG